MGLAIPLDAFILKLTNRVSCINAVSQKTSASIIHVDHFLCSKFLSQSRPTLGQILTEPLQELMANRGDSVAHRQGLASLDWSAPTGQLVLRAGAGH